MLLITQENRLDPLGEVDPVEVVDYLKDLVGEGWEVVDLVERVEECEKHMGTVAGLLHVFGKHPVEFIL